MKPIAEEPAGRPSRPSAGATNRLARKRQALRGQAAAIGGLDFARQYSALFDEALSKIWTKATAQAASHGSQLALVALGGYGRRELCPFSDIDLMILHGGRKDERLAKLSEAVFYPLWNAGLEVGHAARSVKDCMALAAQEFESTTTLLDARLIAGDPRLFEELCLALGQQIARRRKAFVDDSLSAVSERRAAYGEGAYVLEPHLKEGCGSLRDIHQMLWASKALLDASSVSDLIATGHVSAHDGALLREAFDFLLAVRVNLHDLTDRKTDRLHVEYQDELAKRLRYEADAGSTRIDRFMRDYHERSATIKHVTSLFWSRIAPGGGRRSSLLRRGRRVDLGDGFVSTENAVVYEGARERLRDPATALRAFATSVECNLPLAPEAVEAVHEADAAHPVPMTWSAQSRDDFLSILRAGDAGTERLEVMNDVGLLSACIPQWERVRYRPTLGAYHQYTVDMHSFRTAAEIAELARSPERRSPLLGRLFDELADPDAALLAALLHDIGKGDEDHSSRGAEVAIDICRTTGLTGDAGLVEFLVRHHLLLATTAARRDVGESHLLERLAERVGTAERLKMLYLLTVADGRATGPAAWNEWKDALVQELFFNLLHLLETRESAGASSLGPAAHVRAQARETLLAEATPREVDGFLSQLPDSYFSGQVPEAIRRHFELVSGLRPNEIHTLVRSTGTAETMEFTVGAPDRPGLLAKVAGVLALHSRNILAAQTYSLDSGVALEIFLTTGYFDHSPEEVEWRQIAEDLKQALFGRMAIDYRLAQKLKSYRNGPAAHRAPKIVIDNTASKTSTVVEVHADDRIGLLYTISKALHDLDLDIRIAKVSTSVDRAVDAFYVVDAEGRKVIDEAQINEIAKSVEYQLKRG